LDNWITTYVFLAYNVLLLTHYVTVTPWLGLWPLVSCILFKRSVYRRLGYDVIKLYTKFE